jgi:hypothetical protein
METMSEQPPGILAHDLPAFRPPAIDTRPYSRAMSPVPLGADATMRQREQARIDNQTRQADLRAERATQLAAAEADWDGLRARLADNRPALAVLDLHKPADSIYCTTCYDGHDGGDTVDWPCDTYKAIKENTPS